MHCKKADLVQVNLSVLIYSMKMSKVLHPYRTIFSGSRVLPTCLPTPSNGAGTGLRVQSEDVNITGKCSSDGHTISRNGTSMVDAMAVASNASHQ